MKELFALTLTLCVFLSVAQDFNTMPFPDYVQALNYPVETHNITTSDGYTLVYFRIQAKNSQIKTGLPVVYLQHGLLDSSDDWIINDEALAPAFMIANKGYDVWVGNTRGNKYSMYNNQYDIENPSFWNFTWQNMAQFDLPAAFTYISQYTNKKINYVGHSQGTLIMFAALARQNQAILSNMQSFCALGPVAFLNHMSSTLIQVLIGSNVTYFAQELGASYFIPSQTETELMVGFAELTPSLYGDLLSAAAGSDSSFDNYARLTEFAGHYPAGSSILDLLHFQQMYEIPQGQTIMQEYDFGEILNLQYYGQPTPPVYDLSLITFPIHLFVGENDKLADPTDAWNTKLALVNSQVDWHLYPNMGHLTFMLGLNQTYMNDVFTVLEQANSKTFLN